MKEPEGLTDVYSPSQPPGNAKQPLAYADYIASDNKEDELKIKRNIYIYLLIMVLITALGLPARTIQDKLPAWYVQYFGDYLWAMFVFFGFALILSNTGTFKVAIATLLFAYCIEISQLFHPQWLDSLREIRLFGYILGYSFLWSDIVAYTLGISTGALMEHFLLQNILSQETNVQ